MSKPTSFEARQLRQPAQWQRQNKYAGSREAETGTIKVFLQYGGYGYIKPDKPGRDLWFHIRESSIAEPVEGLRVTYFRGTDPRTGRDAAQVVRLLGEPAPTPNGG
jgi:cold shock CspA family protein